MKRLKTKQIITYFVGMLICRVSFAGCYPIIPAYFAAVYLQDQGRAAFTFFLYLGMVLFLPITQTAKYAMAVLVTFVVIKMSEWVNRHCKVTLAAGTAGVATAVLSVFGGVFNWMNDRKPVSGILEGIFIFGLTMVLHRFFYFFFQKKEEKNGAAPQMLPGEERLKTYADSFLGLSQVFSGMSVDKKDFAAEEYGRMKDEIAGKICISCDQCALCWEREKSPIQEYFTALILSIRKNGVPDEKEEKRLRTCCPYTSEVVEEAVRVFEKAKLNMAWYNRLQENREVIAQQLGAMAYIMEDCAKPPEDISAKEEKALAEIRYQAKERGIFVHEGAVYEKKDGKRQLALSVSVKKDGCIPVKELVRAVHAATGWCVRPHRDEKNLIGKERIRLVFEEDTHYHTVHGVARLVKEGASVSGDNFSFQELVDGEFVMSLSDGMGSGSRACKESEMVIELIEKFLEAGFSKETAIRMMNSAMVIRGEDDLFSTVDISALNLYDGNCTFYKIGASATFIRRADCVECLISENLPVGVYHSVEIEKTTRSLLDGDFIIMMSDGVLEYLNVPHPEEAMESIIAGIDTNHPGRFAKQLLDQVLVYTDGKVSDDMTVLVAAVWEKA